MQEQLAHHRLGGHNARRARRQQETPNKVVEAGLAGGAYRPLSDHDVERIHRAALEVLEDVGVADPIPEFQDIALARGARLNDAGRLCFPRALVEDVIAGAGRDFVLHGRDPRHDLEIGGTRVYFGTEGAAPTVFETDSETYRQSTIVDLYDFARLADRLDHVHRFDETVVATELPEPYEHDVNKAYAIAAGTAKNFGFSLVLPEHVEAVVAIFDTMLGGAGRFRERPFAMILGAPVVSPLRYGADNSGVALAAVRAGFPVELVPHPQAGGTGPAALAGTLVQSIAEALSLLLLVNLVVPGHPMIFGSWPVMLDLRRGSYCIGSGETALLNAASAQIANFYDLPGSVYAGATDSKLPDNQAGYEKGIEAATAALSGASFVCESAGMLAGLMGCSFEAMVIDNDMLGMVQRVLRGIEVTDETLSIDVIKETVAGSGHYLNHPQTLSLMETEYLYPAIADRSSRDEWVEQGKPDIRERAAERVRAILSSHYPEYIDSKADETIRQRFPIHLPRQAMRQGNGRW